MHTKITIKWRARRKEYKMGIKNKKRKNVRNKRIIIYNNVSYWTQKKEYEKKLNKRASADIHKCKITLKMFEKPTKNTQHSGLRVRRRKINYIFVPSLFPRHCFSTTRSAISALFFSFSQSHRYSTIHIPLIKNKRIRIWQARVSLWDRKRERSECMCVHVGCFSSSCSLFLFVCAIPSPLLSTTNYSLTHSLAPSKTNFFFILLAFCCPLALSDDVAIIEFNSMHVVVMRTVPKDHLNSLDS